MDNSVYTIFICLRVILTVLPQTGYIHPDEHFQGPEVVYGDIAQFKTIKTWEFTSSRPIRSIVFPYLINGMPSLIVLASTHLGFKTSPYLNMLLPRLIMCCLSFLQDCCIYKISKMINPNYKLNLQIFASSYVVLLYFTRTFSNSLESLFFSLILLFSFQFQHASKKSLKSLTRKAHIFGMLLSAGIFNRPTFICFVLIPMFACFYAMRKMTTKVILQVFLAFLFGSISMTLCFIIIDTLYYSRENFTVFNLETCVFTPLNFVFYNLNESNLSIHQLHSRLTHIFVNVPLLFCANGILILLCSLCKFPSLHYFHKILVLSFFTPLILLSLVPHQEPRFIVPLIVPLCLLVSKKICDVKKSIFFVFSWFLCNSVCLIFLGFVHQSGVYTAISHLQNQTTDSAVVFYKTYMPPRYLFSTTEYDKCNVYDFAGDKLDIFGSNFLTIMEKETFAKIFLITPYNTCVFDVLLESIYSSGYHLTKRYFLFPNFSFEHLFETELTCFIRDAFNISNISKAIFSISITELERIKE